MSSQKLIPNRSNLVTFLSAIGANFAAGIIGVLMTRIVTHAFIAQVGGFVLFMICFFVARSLWTWIGAISEVKERGIKGMVDDTKETFSKIMKATQDGGQDLEEPQDYLRPGGSVFIATYPILASFFAVLVAMFSKTATLGPTIGIFVIGGLVVGFAKHKLVCEGYIDLWESADDPIFENRSKSQHNPPKPPPPPVNF